jgi:hypothetical protein
MARFVEALDAISTQVWAIFLIVMGAGLLVTQRGASPGQALLGAGLIIFRVPIAEKGTGEKTQ